MRGLLGRVTATPRVWPLVLAGAGAEARTSRASEAMDGVASVPQPGSCRHPGAIFGGVDGEMAMVDGCCHLGKDRQYVFPRPRKHTRTVRVGTLDIGGDAPVVVQSMTSTRTEDVDSTIEQIRRLADAGCELVRVAVPSKEAARALGAICRLSPLPVVADIHFDYRLALEALKAGVAKVRVNPGNIGGPDRLAEVAKAAAAAGVAMRLGVNSGSLPSSLLDKHGSPSPEAMVECALDSLAVLEDVGFEQTVLSLKSSSVGDTISAYMMTAERTDYPLHLGVTEAGTIRTGTVYSAVGVGYLLLEGIGDTLRVSLTGDPVEEVRVAWQLLRATGRRQRGVRVVSCPTCGRCQVDVAGLAEEVEQRLARCQVPLVVAVMGCVVNGPGEAREADVGVAGGRREALLFRRGEPLRRVKWTDALEALADEVARLEADALGSD